MYFKLFTVFNYLSRYADKETIINRGEYIGVVNDVRTVYKGFYMYSITTIPLQFTCSIMLDSDIIEKLSDEQIEAEKIKNKII